MEQPQVTEKSLHLTDSDSPMKQFLMSCIIYSAEYYPVMTDWLTSMAIKYCQRQNKQTIIQSILQLMQDMNRENIYGPTASYVSVADRPHNEHLDQCFIRQSQAKSQSQLEQLAKLEIKDKWISQFVPIQNVEQIFWYKRSNFLKNNKFINKSVTNEVLKQLQVNGQSWIKTTPLPTLLLTLEHLLKALVSIENGDIKFNLLLARISFLHNKILQNPSKDLSDLVLGNYRKYISHVNKQNKMDLLAYVCLHLEYANALVFYYKYTECQKILQFCKQLTNVEVQFTGKLGRRTKYQSFDTAQLIMNIKSKGQKKQSDNKNDEEDDDKDAIKIPNAKEIILKQIQINKPNSQVELQTSKFDQESILLQKPKFVEEQGQKQKVPIHKILVALASIQYMWETTPKDQVLYQHIATSIQTLLELKQSFSYPIMFNVLLLRSLNELPRTKNVERALDQLEKIRNNFNQKTHKNMDHLYGCPYTPYGQFIKILAQKYMQMGMTMTAIELYQKVGMIQQCIDGLIAKNFKEKAQGLAARYEKQYGRTPRLLCMLGDLQQGQNSVKLYQQAWKLSQMRNARCQRSLGWYYFKKKNFQKAAQSFKKATQANFYHPNTWFTLGCCYIQLKDYQKAIPAFGQCVCIDDTQGEAWANIATCYIHQNRYKQAYSTLEQALKFSQKNWKMWSNMLSVSLKVKKFYKFFQCVEKLVDQQKSQLINIQILKKVTSIFQYQQQSSQRRRNIQAMKNRLDRFYRLLIDKIGQNPIVWRSIYQYNLQLQQYTIANYKHYKKLHQQNKIDVNDVLDGYQNLQNLDKNVKQLMAQIRENILSSKQTELNMAMKIGWQSIKKNSQQVAAILQEYMDTFQKYNPGRDQKTINEFKLFVNGVRLKIQSCLEKKIELKSTLL